MKRNQGIQGKSRGTTGVANMDDETVAQGTTLPSTSTYNETGFEEAIRQSVEATSTGNAEEDSMIEKAIRASVVELRQASTEGNESDALERAIQASLQQANQARSHNEPASSSTLPTRTTEHDEEIEKALRISMQNHDSVNDTEQLHLRHDWDDSGVDTDDDENIKLALEHSKLPATSPPAYDDDDLQRALKQSLDHQTREDGKTAARSEEEIVLDYIKKQSLAEEEHRQAMARTSGPDG